MLVGLLGVLITIQFCFSLLLEKRPNSCSLLLFKTDDNYDYDDDDDDNDNDGNDDDENDDDEWLCSDICVHCIYIGRLVSSCGRLCH